MRLSALEQVPLFDGHDPRRTLEEQLRLATGLEELGYERLWFAEHHSTGAFLSSVPPILMAHVLASTTRIRIGSGGVMAMHQGSLQMAETFHLLATLHPGRVDMGLGRAPGGDMVAAHALNQGRVIDPRQIDALIEETIAIMRRTVPAEHPYAGLRAQPEPELAPQMWLLGSSGQSAAWAGAHGLNYAYAQFFSGRQQPEIMDHYRSHLPATIEVGEGAPAPAEAGLTLSALCVAAAPSADEARELALPAASFRLRLRSGRPASFTAPSAMSAAERAEALAWLERDTAIIVGSYDEVADRIRGFAAAHRVDEAMLISYIADVERKLEQYRELGARLAD